MVLMTEEVEQDPSPEISDVGLEKDLGERIAARIPRYQKDKVAYMARISNRSFSGQLRQILDEWINKVELEGEGK